METTAKNDFIEEIKRIEEMTGLDVAFDKRPESTDFTYYVGGVRFEYVPANGNEPAKHKIFSTRTMLRRVCNQWKVKMQDNLNKVNRRRILPTETSVSVSTRSTGGGLNLYVSAYDLNAWSRRFIESLAIAPCGNSDGKVWIAERNILEFVADFLDRKYFLPKRLIQEKKHDNKVYVTFMGKRQMEVGDVALNDILTAGYCRKDIVRNIDRLENMMMRDCERLSGAIRKYKETADRLTEMYKSALDSANALAAMKAEYLKICGSPESAG